MWGFAIVIGMLILFLFSGVAALLDLDKKAIIRFVIITLVLLAGNYFYEWGARSEVLILISLAAIGMHNMFSSK